MRINNDKQNLKGTEEKKYQIKSNPNYFQINKFNTNLFFIQNRSNLVVFFQ